MKKFYKEHLEYVQNFWKNILVKGDRVIDATLGNGHDCLTLCKLILTENKGMIFGYDIQLQAIDNTKQKLAENLPNNLSPRIKLFHKSHENFQDIKDEKIKLINYNLGYLPGCNKNITTTPLTTIKSLKNALQLNPQYISIICYSGHQIGKVEEAKILHFFTNLPKNKWTVTLQQWINREFFPSVFLLKQLSK